MLHMPQYGRERRNMQSENIEYTRVMGNVWSRYNLNDN